jgi:hypothetical protein
MVDPQQTPFHPIWRTPSVHDLYEKINFSRQLFNPPHTYVTPSADAGPSSKYTNHPIGKTINTTTTSANLISEKGFFLPIHLKITVMVTPIISLQEKSSYMHIKYLWDTFTSKNGKPCHTTKPDCRRSAYPGGILH